MEGQRVWNNILSSFKSQVSSSTFKTWFAGSYVLDYKKNTDKNLLIVAVKNNFLKEQVETRYLSTILQIAKQKGFGNVEVVLVVSQKETNGAIKNEPLFSGEARGQIFNLRKAEALNPAHTFENFVVGFSNNLAYMAAVGVANNLGSVYNPLLLYGPTGVGKTHLLQAVGNEALSKTENVKVLYASAEKFTNDYIESLINKTQQSFRAKYRGVDLLLVDDVQFFAGKESTQDEFFHTFNELHLSGRQVVAACDRHPKELGRLKERLVSRFLGGMAADIGLPDLEMKMAIVRAKCQEKGINLDEEIVSYIAGACPGGARELEGILISVLAQVKLSAGGATLEEVRKTVEKNRQAVRPKPDPDKIIGVVCQHFKATVEELSGPKRDAPLVFARQVLMFLLRKTLDLPLSAIGELVGGRDHSTILHGIQKVERLISQNQRVRDEVLRLQATIF